jgi:hypothetical protein
MQCNARLFECSGKLFFLVFFHFLLLFVTFFTTCNFCKLLFTVESGKVSYFNLFFDNSGGGGVPLFIYFDFFYY